jgi:hypothetical protein
MTDDKLVEAVARAMLERAMIAEAKGQHGNLEEWLDDGGFRDMAHAAIAAVRQHTENDWK